MIVLDACAAMAMVQGSPDGIALKGLKLSEELVVCPSVYEMEVCNAVWKEIHFRNIEKDLGFRWLDQALRLVDEFVPARSCLREVLSESVRLNHPAYDIFYFVLARRLGATLFTLDKKLIKLCEQEGVDCIRDVSF